jgi:3-oxoacyl-[acyl-carrier protein] reductase
MLIKASRRWKERGTHEEARRQGRRRHHATSKEGADRVAADIKATGGDARVVQADVSKSADVKRLFAETRRAYDRLDILVNNAAVFQFDALEAVTEAEFQRQFGTNVLGPLLAIQEAVKHFGEGGGSIVNVGTVASEARLPASVVYAASKSALDAVTRALSAELGPRRIRVNTLSPGGVETEGFRAMGELGEGMRQMLVPRTALGRLGRPDDIAKVAVFLASDEAAWITGERLVVSGGFY